MSENYSKPSDSEELHEAQRVQSWQEFCDAADAAVRLDYGPALKLTGLHPNVRDELHKFVKAINEGRIVKVGPYKYESSEEEKRKFARAKKESIRTGKQIRQEP